MTAVITLVCSYFVGSVLFGPLVARRRGVDLYAAGSGNPGATNVERTLGRRDALVVMSLDAAKGAICVVTARALGFGEFESAIAALGAVVGHCWPALDVSRGGKGVATAFGAVAALDPLAGSVAVLGYLTSRGRSGYASVGSLVGAGLGAATVAWRLESMSARAAVLGLAAVVLLRHRDNLRRLSRGEEPPATTPPPDVEED